MSLPKRFAQLGLLLGSSLVVTTTLAQERPLKAPEYRDAGEMEIRVRDGQSEAVATSGTAIRLIGQQHDRARLEQRLRVICGNRLRLESANGQRVYRLTSGRRVLATLIFDERRQGLIAEATPTILDQVELLVEALGEPPPGTDQRTAIVSIERTDRLKLRQAIEAYRRGRATAADNGSSAMPSGYSKAGLALVNFVLQDDNPQPTSAEQPPATPTPEVPGAGAAVGAGGLDVDVDVQTLPDLDVIILRGRDRDVRKLTDIIEELERLVGSPGTELEFAL